MSFSFKLASVFAIFICISCSLQELPKLGVVWSSSTIEGEKIFTPNGIEKKAIIELNKVEFQIGIDANNKVDFIGTRNPSFKINNYGVGMQLSEFKNKDKIKRYLGWGHYLKIDEEWYALFDFNKVSDSSKAMALFKYKF